MKTLKVNVKVSGSQRRQQSTLGDVINRHQHQQQQQTRTTIAERNSNVKPCTATASKVTRTHQLDCSNLSGITVVVSLMIMIFCF
jgi:hypothetical protein